MSEPTGVPTFTVQLVEPGHHAVCSVCEMEPGAQTGLSKRHWIFVPTARELLYVCLNCGNTERSRRME